MDAEGRRTPALRFGDPRVMALAGALCQTLLAATGFTSKNLRVLIAGLLGSSYTPGQMTYDLRRLRLGGLIRRLPHTNRYTLTEDGIRIAVFYTKIYNRLLVPLTAANQPQAPPGPPRRAGRYHLEVLTLAIFCHEGHPPADDIFVYDGCPQPVPA